MKMKYEGRLWRIVWHLRQSLRRRIGLLSLSLSFVHLCLDILQFSQLVIHFSTYLLLNQVSAGDYARRRQSEDPPSLDLMTP
jgi:hypothetical protein